jgi:16S rRNA A1518/A1519 N6-dimethyltransferase RsmA/KsgA/DIM1 with predicted DNA glycosylase/AP lyase activity
MFLTVIQLVFLILFTRQIIIVLIAWWTGTQSDVPFQSTKKSVLKKLTKYLKIKPNQKIYDLGSGSGQVAFFLAQNTVANIIGVEKNKPLYLISKFKKILYPQLKIKFINQDLFRINLSDADIIYTYFSPRAYKKAQPKFEQELKLETILVAWRYPFNSSKFKLIHQIKDRHTMYIYQKQR